MFFWTGLTEKKPVLLSLYLSVNLSNRSAQEPSGHFFILGILVIVWVVSMQMYSVCMSEHNPVTTKPVTLYETYAHSCWKTSLRRWCVVRQREQSVLESTPNGCQKANKWRRQQKKNETVIWTHIVELSLVSEQRMVLPVFALAVFVGDEAPPLVAAAIGHQSFTWRDVSRPETVYPLVAQQQEQLHHR